ncbi:MAG: PQQ-binding-like beta-propeller repeat protein, partial [Armatimonadota bacterium]|nr:PQQ-binding-like beta-propeller repeat protein [Armatimonadota bacterium]
PQPPAAPGQGREASRAVPARPAAPAVTSSQILGRLDFPKCPQCSANVGMQSELCPRCHSRVRRCLAGHISGPTANECAHCERPLLAVSERWAVFRGAGSSGWTPEAVRPPLRLAWKFRPPEGYVQWTSPVLDANLVYAGASDGFIYAIRGGVALWRSPMDGPIRTDFVPETCVPACEEGKVFIGHMGGAVAAVEAATGKMLWQTDVRGTPSGPIRPALGCLFVPVSPSPNDGAVCALDMDGNELWRYPIKSPVYCCPAYAATSIIVTTADGSILALRAGRDVEGDRLLWRHDEHGDEFDTSVAVSREGIYATSHAGKMLCLHPQTGEVIRRWMSPTGNLIHSSPAIGAGGTDGQVYFGTDDRSSYVVSALTAQTIVAHLTGGVILGSPVISDDIVYVGSQDGSLYAIGPGCHRIEAAYKLSAGLQITSSPAVGNGLVVFAGSDGYLYALEACGAG